MSEWVALASHTSTTAQAIVRHPNPSRFPQRCLQICNRNAVASPPSPLHPNTRRTLWVPLRSTAFQNHAPSSQSPKSRFGYRRFRALPTRPNPLLLSQPDQ